MFYFFIFPHHQTPHIQDSALGTFAFRNNNNKKKTVPTVWLNKKCYGLCNFIFDLIESQSENF